MEQPIEKPTQELSRQPQPTVPQADGTSGLSIFDLLFIIGFISWVAYLWITRF